MHVACFVRGFAYFTAQNGALQRWRLRELKFEHFRSMSMLEGLLAGKFARGWRLLNSWKILINSTNTNGDVIGPAKPWGHAAQQAESFLYILLLGMEWKHKTQGRLEKSNEKKKKKWNAKFSIIFHEHILQNFCRQPDRRTRKEAWTFVELLLYIFNRSLPSFRWSIFDGFDHKAN